MRFFSTTIICLLFFVACSENQPPPAKRIPAELSTVLKAAGVLELHSLDPTRRGDEADPPFQHWRDLGSTNISNANAKSKLLDSLDAAVAANDGSIADCFFPRHALRAKHEGKTYDVVICFQCSHAHWYIDDTQQSQFLLTASAKKTLDDFLVDANIELAPTNPE